MTPSESLQAGLARHLKNMPSAPRQLLPIIRDITPERLIQRLVEEVPVVGLIADEGRQILDGYAARSVSLINGLRDGSPQYVERKGSGRQFISFVRLTSNIATQQNSAKEYFARNDARARDSGHLARQFVAWPTSTQGYRPIDSTTPMPWVHVPVFNKRVKDLLQQTLDKHQSPLTRLPVLRLSPAAAYRWTNYANAVEADQRLGHPLCNIRDAASKAAENVARLAAVMHAFDGAAGDISLHTVENAIAMVNWYLTQFIRIFVPPPVPQILIDAHALDCWLRHNYLSLNGSHSYRKNWILQRSPLRKKDQLDGALQVLVNGGQVQVWRDAKKTWCVNFIANSPPVPHPQQH